MGLLFTPEIDRNFILSRVSEEEIFEKYGVPVEDRMFRSPLRMDRRPTCRFYRNKTGRLILHDFSGHFHGDCFDLVCRMKGMKFYDAAKDIALTFGIIKGAPRSPKVSSTITFKTICELNVRTAPWDKTHLKFWEDYGITPSTLDLYNVKCAEKVWLNGSVFYNRTYAVNPKPVFAYWFGGKDYKVYFPFRETMRFLHNNPDILQGYEQLPESGEVVIITKALKDVMALREFGIPAVAPMSETHVPSDEVLEDLKERFGRVFALYDRDRTGITSLINLRRRHVTPILIPEGDCKDFSDVCKKDLHLAKKLIDDFAKNLR